MKRILSFVVVLGSGVLFVSCGGGGGGGGGSVLAPLLADSTVQDLSGQQSSFSGDLGGGTTTTFPAIMGSYYAIQVDTTDSGDLMTLDFWGADGSHLRSKSVDSGENFKYKHEYPTQHVLMICRPRNPLASVDVTSLTVVGTGSFAKTSVHVNVFVVGKFAGLGYQNNLNTPADKGAFTDNVMLLVNNLFTQTGINVTYTGYAYTAGDITNGSLIGPDDQAICSSSETKSATGFDVPNTQGLDAWAQFGFPVSDPDFNAGHGINVFVINHFDEDGTVGLSPRPGVLAGNGPDSAMAAAGFLKQGGTLFPRTEAQVATVLAHEIGHFLGLLHTTTFEPDFVNPTSAVDDGLADTPACTVLTDVNNDGIVGLGDGCQDEGNVMFFMAGNQLDFSAGQSSVMQNLLSAQEH